MFCTVNIRLAAVGLCYFWLINSSGHKHTLAAKLKTLMKTKLMKLQRFLYTLDIWVFAFIGECLPLSANVCLYQRMFAFISECLPLSANVCLYRRMFAFIGECLPLSANVCLYQRMFAFISECHRSLHFRRGHL